MTLNEERPCFKSDKLVQLNITQFRLDQEEWKVFWQDSKDKWHDVENIKPNKDFDSNWRNRSG